MIIFYDEYNLDVRMGWDGYGAGPASNFGDGYNGNGAGDGFGIAGHYLFPDTNGDGRGDGK